MAIPPTAYLRFERAYRRGDHLVVLSEGDRVADALHAAGMDDRIPEVLAQVGAVHASQDRYQPAIAYLEQALSMHAASAPRPTGPTGAAAQPADRPSTAALPGPFGSPGAPTPGAPALPGGPVTSSSPMTSTATRAARAANQLDGFELVLLDVDLRVGRYRDVLARVPGLVDPTHDAEVRFAATRAHATVLGVQGQFESAHHLLNTAGGVATRIRSRLRVALVEGDRAILLANQGRLLEAITSADRVLPSLIRPALGTHQQWANAQGAAVALSVSRAASAGGDHLTAQRMLLLGTTATERVASPYLRAHVELARGAFWLLEGELDAAEAALIDAGRRFGVLGCTPAVALATLQQGRLAQARGLARSAGPLYRQALDEFRTLGQAREVSEINRLLVTIDHP